MVEADFSRHPAISEAEGAELVVSLEDVLRKHVVDAWFPRSVDLARGGFNCDFDRRWRPCGPQLRMLEFQARQTRSAARLAIAFPEEERFAEIAIHGFRYLRDVMWDHDYGGWYWMVSPKGTPLAAATKHGHGTSYGAQACALVFAATGETEARALAEESFTWFDRHAHDEERGGYHGWLTREGRAIQSSADIPSGAGSHDPVAHGIGLRDTNVHGDWLESLNDLASILELPFAIARRAELARLFIDYFTTPAGDIYSALHPNWRPLPQPERFGFAFQITHRLIAAADDLSNGEQLRERALAVAEHALVTASRGAGGGFGYFHGVGGPDTLAGVSTRNCRRVWWVQVEALRALASLATLDSQDGRYNQLLLTHWAFIRDRLVDPIYGGFYATLPADLGRRHRPVGRLGNSSELAKGNVWKDASHETDALLATIQSVWGAIQGDIAAVPSPST